jgi:hypothetical protein
MQIALIPPRKYLELYENESDIFMCLAPFLKNKDYFNFFKKKVAEGKFVMLDNGAAEGEMLTSTTLVREAVRLGVSEIIAPDYLNNGYKTREKVKEFLNKKYNTLHKEYIKIQAVVQGCTLEDALTTLEMYVNDDRINTIGLPFAGLDFFK